MIQKKGQGCPAGVAVSETPNLTARANGLPLGEPRAPEDQATAEKRLRYRHNGASDTIRKIEDHTAIGAFGSGALETYKTDGNRRDENPVGVRDTYSNDQSGTAVGALNMDIYGADGAQYGVFDRSIGASDTHSKGESGIAVGALDTHNGGFDPSIGASDTHRDGTDDIHNGAIGAVRRLRYWFET